MTIPLPPRQMRNVLAIFLLSLPTGLMLADMRNWQNVLQFCHAFWDSVIRSSGMLASHLLLVALAAWVGLRLFQFSVAGLAARRRWKHFYASHRTNVLAGPAGVVTLVSSATPFAFTSGWFRPATYCSTGLQKQLTKEEFRAVLYHEAFHRRHHDPARILLWKLSAALFPMLPLISAFGRAALSEYECAADRASEHEGVSREALLSAIRQTLRAGGTLPSFSAASFAVAADLRVRLRSLHRERIVRSASLRAALITLVSLTFFTLPFAVMRTNQANASRMVQCDAPRTPPMSEPTTLQYRPVQTLSSAQLWYRPLTLAFSSFAEQPRW